VKMAAARANFDCGQFSKEILTGIEGACQELIDGKLHGEFRLDVFQGGAGTSTNMNANEVIANRALELMGHRKGEYTHCDPHDHVNCSQSTNDAYPSALHIGMALGNIQLVAAVNELIAAFRAKGREFGPVLKMGRTQLQDAVPMTLGQEFDAFHVTVKEDIARIREIVGLFREVNLGATAIGTGINTDPRYASLAVEELARVSGQPMVLAGNLVEATSDMGAFVLFSGLLKRIAVKLSKICNDLRLLSSGPRTGFGEIRLPPMQAGSSIMPGKVNPVIPEVVNQVAYQVIGNDLTVTLAAEAGQLQLNAFEPIIVHSLFKSLTHLDAASRALIDKCVTGITANADRLYESVVNSIGVITALNPYIGYAEGARIAKLALASDRPIPDLIVEQKLLSHSQVTELLRPESFVGPRMSPSAVSTPE
jgi:aspartate ammonia-lyase